MSDTELILRYESERGKEGSELRQECPECGDKLVTDERQAQTRCMGCVPVVDEDETDHDPEWRAYDAGESESKSRTGAPMTELMHDRGLSTTTGWKNEDAFGSSLSAEQRKKMSRLWTWNEQYRTRDSDDRNLKKALGEINRMASTLGLPKSTRETHPSSTGVT